VIENTRDATMIRDVEAAGQAQFRIRSAELFRSQRHIVIVPGGSAYRFDITRTSPRILTT
jgi:hemin uptake protein HemP